MRTMKDVEAYLGKLNRQFSAVEDQPGTFVIASVDGKPPIAVRVDTPLVVLRVHIGDVSKADGPGLTALFKRLLQLNAAELVHSSYGLEGERIVLSAALELENLDFNEIEATLDEMDIALAQQVPELSELSKKAS